MQSYMVLVSDDSDFFDYMNSIIELRKDDKIFQYSFDEIPMELHKFNTAVFVINSEGKEEKTLELLKFIKDKPTAIFAYNEDEDFKIQCYKEGMLNWFTPLSSKEEIKAKLTSALNRVSLHIKEQRYRELLVESGHITGTNEVYADYNGIIEREIKRCSDGDRLVLAAIAPDERAKFLIKPNHIETIILNNIRKNDILMNYATNKYFLLMFNTDIDSAKKLWSKISQNFPQKIYAGFVNPISKSREQAVSEVLTRLHEEINAVPASKNLNAEVNYLSSETANFKDYRKTFHKKIEQIVSPVFYRLRQKCEEKLFESVVEHFIDEGFALFNIKGKNSSASIRVTTPGLSKINIDITVQNNKDINSKRISFEPEEFEAGVLEDLTEQFVSEYIRSCND